MAKSKHSIWFSKSIVCATLIAVSAPGAFAAESCESHRGDASRFATLELLAKVPQARVPQARALQRKPQSSFRGCRVIGDEATSKLRCCSLDITPADLNHWCDASVVHRNPSDKEGACQIGSEKIQGRRWYCPPYHAANPASVKSAVVAGGAKTAAPANDSKVRNAPVPVAAAKPVAVRATPAPRYTRAPAPVDDIEGLTAIVQDALTAKDLVGGSVQAEASFDDKMYAFFRKFEKDPVILAHAKAGIEAIRKNPRYAHLFANVVGLSLEESGARYITGSGVDSGKINYLAFKPFSTQEEFDASLADVRTILDKAARPDCQIAELQGDVTSFISELNRCAANSIGDLGDADTKKLFTRERFIAATIAARETFPSFASETFLHLINQWKYLWSWDRTSMPLNGSLNAMAASIFDSNIERINEVDRDMQFEILWGTNLYDRGSAHVEALSKFILDPINEDQGLLRGRATSAITRGSAVKPEDFRSVESARTIVSLATALRDRKDDRQLLLLVDDLKGFTDGEAKTAYTDFLLSLSKDKSLPLSQISAIRVLSKDFRIDVDGDGRFDDYEVAKTDFYAEKLPNIVTLSGRQYQTGLNLISTRAMIKDSKTGYDRPKKQSEMSAAEIAQSKIDSVEVIEKLDKALDDTEASFMKVLGITDAIPQNLQIKIVNDPTDYEMLGDMVERFGSSNGGIYMSNDANPQPRFYTYDRTRVESIYSLEELTRHEYTHHLQHKYFGGLRSNWFNISKAPSFWVEGLAEFMVSAKPDGTVPHREIMLKRLSTNGSHFSFDRIVSNDEWSFAKYQYGYMVFHYLYENNRPLFYQVMDAVKKGSYRYVDSKNNTFTKLGYSMDTLNQEFSSYLKTEIARYMAEQKAKQAP